MWPRQKIWKREESCEYFDEELYDLLAYEQALQPNLPTRKVKKNDSGAPDNVSCWRSLLRR
jgi:hypothetical protein